MPALEPNPTGGQRTFLRILGVMLGVSIVIAVIASFAAGN